MKHIKTFESFVNETNNSALQLAKKLMNNDSYKTLDDAIEDMHKALDYGVEDEDEIRDFLDKYDK